MHVFVLAAVALGARTVQCLDGAPGAISTGTARISLIVAPATYPKIPHVNIPAGRIRAEEDLRVRLVSNLDAVDFEVCPLLSGRRIGSNRLELERIGREGSVNLGPVAQELSSQINRIPGLPGANPTLVLILQPKS